MTLRSIITRTATIALAAAALAAPAASARPADLPPAAATANAAEQHKQSRRSADADGASRYRHAGIGAVREYPTRPAQGEQANLLPNSTPTAPADRDIAWTTIGLGAAAGLMALAAIAGIAREKRRDARPRVTA